MASWLILSVVPNRRQPLHLPSRHNYALLGSVVSATAKKFPDHNNQRSQLGIL